jgi:hypothetical protein
MKLFIALSTVVALAATGIYNILLVRNAISLVPTQRIISDERIPQSFDQSLASKITNPKNHPPIHDTRHLSIRVAKNLSDEEILAHFVKGFFGGFVFRPERSILRATGIAITDFVGKASEDMQLQDLTCKSFERYTCVISHLVASRPVLEGSPTASYPALRHVPSRRLSHATSCFFANVGAR